MKSYLKCLILIFLAFISLTAPVFSYSNEIQMIDTYVEKDKDEYKRFYFEGNFKEKTTFFGHYYKPTYDNNRLILILPNIEGITPLEVQLGNYMAKNGYNVIIPQVHGLIDEKHDYKIKNLDAVHLTHFALTKSLTNYFKDRNILSFDPQNIGVLGASLGGIRSCIQMGLNPNIKAIFISVAGINLPDIYANSDEETVVAIRRKLMRKLNLENLDAFKETLEKQLTVDSSVIMNSINKDNVAMIIADADKTVPAVNQWELWSLLTDNGHRPQTYVKDWSHKMGAIYLLGLRGSVLEFMNHHLSVN